MTARKTVYVSSTFVDLKEHRARLKVALEKAGYDVGCMEKYSAFDERPKDKCLQDVAACDIYVLLVAHRYGFCPPADNPDGKSITHFEYECADRAGKPCLAFLVDEDHPWPPKMVDRGEARTRVEAFRRQVALDRGADTFTDPGHLVGQVLQALTALTAVERRNHRPGVAPELRAAWHQLPAVPEHFVGRSATVQAIADDIRQAYATGSRERLVRVIEGAGGLGKTALAIAIGHALAPDFPAMQLSR